MTESIDLPLMSPDALARLAWLDALAALDPDGRPADWEPGGIAFEALADLLHARGPRLKPAVDAVYAAGLGPWIELLAGRDPVGFACLARWEDDPSAVPPAAAAAIGDMAVCRSQAWIRVREAWERQDLADAASHALATGVGIRPGSWKGIRERLGIGPHGETATDGPVASSFLTRRGDEPDGEGLEIPSFLLRRGGR